MFYKNQVKRRMTNALCHSAWGKVSQKIRIINSSKYSAQAKLYFSLCTRNLSIKLPDFSLSSLTQTQLWRGMAGAAHGTRGQETQPP